MKDAEGFQPFVPGESHVPDYYVLPVRTLDGNVVSVDVFEIIKAAELDFVGGCVVKYALRAGKKPGASAAKDRAKCAESAQRWAAG